MNAAFSCAHCAESLEEGDLYCARCGRPTSSITWELTNERRPGRSEVRVRPGESLFLRARNSGIAPVRVEVEPRNLQGFRLIGGSGRRVAPGQSQIYELKHVPGEEILGVLLRGSEDGPREFWWERRSWDMKELRLGRFVHLHEERWRIGTETLFFPPDVRYQHLRLWNDSDRERELPLEAPHGYRVNVGGQADPAALVVPGGAAVDLLVQAQVSANPERQWHLSSDTPPLTLHRAADPRPAGGADAVVAIDFGTRNTGVRVRWRRSLVSTKPAGTVDAVGDTGSNARFPSQMVLNRKERGMRWGEDAAQYIAGSRMKADEVAIGNLKSSLRAGVDRFTAHHPAWTNAELLARYFERLFGRLDEYFRTADPATPLSRDALAIRYVVCRPVLDADSGDEIGRRYEDALRMALARCGVAPEALAFVHEPVAAAIGIARRRDEALLSLPDGAAIAVVDSGGGTTDIATARVRLRGGKVGLELAGSWALRLGKSSPANEALEHFGLDDRELGGNVLDWCLARLLTVRPQDLLESDGKPIPARVYYGSERDTGEGGGVSTPSLAALRNFVLTCRRMKERFAQASTQYLNRAPSKRVKGEVLPYPTRTDLEGISLVHSLYEENLLRPLLVPVVGSFTAQLGEAASATSVRAEEVRRVFYVGGTCIDPYVRMHFGQAFPLAPPEIGGETQAPERIAERLNAVVEGAVWFDEQIFPPSPLTLTLSLADGNHLLAMEGDALPPAAVAPARFFTQVLEAGDELIATLVVSGGELAAPVEVARGFYRNERDTAIELTLATQLSRDEGSTATLRAGAENVPLWRFALVRGAEDTA